MGNQEIFKWGHCVSKKYEKFGVGTLREKGELLKTGSNEKNGR
jgi:hypothetical protein